MGNGPVHRVREPQAVPAGKLCAFAFFPSWVTLLGCRMFFVLAPALLTIMGVVAFVVLAAAAANADDASEKLALSLLLLLLLCR